MPCVPLLVPLAIKAIIHPAVALLKAAAAIHKVLAGRRVKTKVKVAKAALVAHRLVITATMEARLMVLMATAEGRRMVPMATTEARRTVLAIMEAQQTAVTRARPTKIQGRHLGSTTPPTIPVRRTTRAPITIAVLAMVLPIILLNLVNTGFTTFNIR